MFQMDIAAVKAKATEKKVLGSVYVLQVFNAQNQCCG